jgi:hypothetical protein
MLIALKFLMKYKEIGIMQHTSQLSKLPQKRPWSPQSSYKKKYQKTKNEKEKNTLHRRKYHNTKKNQNKNSKHTCTVRNEEMTKIN